MDIQQIFDLMDRFDASSITGLELELGGARLKLEKSGAVPPAPPAARECLAPVRAAAPVAEPVAAPVPDKADYIKAPLVGTFYAAPAPGKAPFAPVGSTVRQGQTVCVLEAMKMMSEIPAPFDCVVEEVLCADGALAGFDSPLFRVKKLSV